MRSYGFQIGFLHAGVALRWNRVPGCGGCHDARSEGGFIQEMTCIVRLTGRKYIGIQCVVAVVASGESSKLRLISSRSFEVHEDALNHMN